MDTKIEIKEEDPLSDNIASQSERKFFTKNVTIKSKRDVVLLDDCDVAIKSETPSPDFCSQKDRESCAKHVLKQIKPETVTSSSNCEIYMKADIEEQKMISYFGTQNSKEEDPVTKKYNSNHEVIEIKVEPWWLQPEASSVCDEIKDEAFPPVKSSRLSMKAVSGNSSVESILSSAEVSRNYSNLYNERDHSEYESQDSDVTEHVYSEQSGKSSDEEISSSLDSKQNNLIHKGKGSHECNICEKRFKCMSDLKLHKSIHGIEKLHMCTTCNKSFTQLSSLKRHNLIHEGKKPHQCKTCDKRFIRSSDLKNHTLIHEGKKPHQCKTCNKRFTDLSTMKRHSLIHEGKKPHKCRTCDKSFTQLSSMKRHSLSHERKSAYYDRVVHQCKTS